MIQYIYIISLIPLYYFIYKLSIFFSKNKTINPLFSVFIGIIFFIIFPLTIIVFNNGYIAPFYFGIEGNWGNIILNFKTLYPFYIIYITLLFIFLFFIEFKNKILLFDYKLYKCLHSLKLKKLKKLILILFLFYSLIVIYFIIKSGGIYKYFLLAFYERQNIIIHNELLYLILNAIEGSIKILLVAISLLFINVLYSQRKRDILFILFIFIIQLIIVLTTGNRIYFVILFVFTTALAFMYKNWKYFFNSILLIPIIFIFMMLWTFVRNNLLESINILDKYSNLFDVNSMITNLLTAVEGMNIIVLFHIIQDFGIKYQYLYGLSYFKLIVFFIPRFIFPNKPINFTTYIAELYEPNSIGFSLNSTILGEMYANIGFFTVVFFPFIIFILLFLLCKIIKNKSNIIIIYLLSVNSFWLIRGTIPEIFISIIMAIIFLKGLNFEKNLFYTTFINKL